MPQPTLTDAKRRLLSVLKRTGPSRSPALAEQLNLTEVAVRQHLAALFEMGLVDQQRAEPTGRGRPAIEWSLTEAARELFPERHADLTLGLIDATRAALGESGLNKIIAARADAQVAQYRAQIGASGSLRKRVEALVDIRTREGYMAEFVEEKRGTYLLIENHCPICAAATVCTGLCQAELDVFRRVLGEDTAVERVEYLLTGDRRCAYRVTKQR